ncbi:MAG: hypothetical protein QXF75_01140 [Candidatus Bathyarchaeia archaeon]
MSRDKKLVTPPRLSIADLLEIQHTDINFDNFSVEEIEELIGDEIVQRYLKMVKEARLTRSPELENYQKELKEQVKKKSYFILERKVSEELRWRRASGFVSIASWL